MTRTVNGTGHTGLTVRVKRSLRADAVKDAITEPDQDICYSLPLGTGKQPVLKVTGWTRADIAAPALADTEETLAEESWSSLVRDNASKPSNLEIISPARITKPDGKVVVCQTMERVALSVNAEDGCTRDQYQSRAEAVTAGFNGMKCAWLAVYKSNRRRAVASTPRHRRDVCFMTRRSASLTARLIQHGRVVACTRLTG